MSNGTLSANEPNESLRMAACNWFAGMPMLKPVMTSGCEATGEGAPTLPRALVDCDELATCKCGDAMAFATTSDLFPCNNCAKEVLRGICLMN